MGEEITLLRLPQVSTRWFPLDVHPTDSIERELALPGFALRDFWPPVQGRKITRISITLNPGKRSFLPFGYLFW